MERPEPRAFEPPERQCFLLYALRNCVPIELLACSNDSPLRESRWTR